jgi:hypothetical protein
MRVSLDHPGLSVGDLDGRLELFERPDSTGGLLAESPIDALATRGYRPHAAPGVRQRRLVERGGGVDEYVTASQLVCGTADVLLARQVAGDVAGPVQAERFVPGLAQRLHDRPADRPRHRL